MYTGSIWKLPFRVDPNDNSIRRFQFSNSDPETIEKLFVILKKKTTLIFQWFLHKNKLIFTIKGGMILVGETKEEIFLLYMYYIIMVKNGFLNLK